MARDSGPSSGGEQAALFFGAIVIAVLGVWVPLQIVDPPGYDGAGPPGAVLSLFTGKVQWTGECTLVLIVELLVLIVPTVVVYSLAAVLLFIPARLREPNLTVQVTAGVAIDVVAIVMLMYASGGVLSGMGILLLMSLAMLTIFGKGSTPDADPRKYPPLDDIRSAFERVHAAALTECAKLKDADLDAPALKPHRLFTTKLGSLQWCARHEMLHAGQIALLRRMIGRKPTW